jgi:hypothetical protein
MISKYCASELPPKCTGYIYSLNYPNGEIFYIGKTKSPYERYAAHVSDAKSKSVFINLRKKGIIKNLLDKGEKPSMCIIEDIPIRTYYDEIIYNKREYYWMSQYLQDGCALTNIRVTDGEQYEINYRRLLIEAKENNNLNVNDFYYGLDEKGFPIYNLKQINELGFSFSPNQFAKHWDYILNLEKYSNIPNTSLDYSCYCDIPYEEK